MRRKKFTPEYEAVLLDANADPVNRANTIKCMLSDELRLHETLVLSFLDDPSEDLRAASLTAAVTWYAEVYLPLLGQRLLHDPSEIVRGSASICAWRIAVHQPATRSTILPWLAQVAAGDEDVINRCSAYRYFLEVVTDGAERPTFNPDTFDPDRDIDHARLRPYLDMDPTPQLH